MRWNDLLRGNAHTECCYTSEVQMIIKQYVFTVSLQCIYCYDKLINEHRLQRVVDGMQPRETCGFLFPGCSKVTVDEHLVFLVDTAHSYNDHV